MNRFWAYTWQSQPRASMAGLILSILIASTLYGFNWYSFYDTRSNFAKARAVIIAEDIKTLALATKAPDIVVFFGDAEGIVGIYGGCGDGDHPGDSCLGGVIEDLVDAPGVVGEGEVGVGVDHGGMIGKGGGLLLKKAMGSWQ